MKSIQLLTCGWLSLALWSGCKHNDAGADVKVFQGDLAFITNAFPGSLQMRIMTSAGEFRCGGSFISSRIFITAAHCVDDKPKSVSVKIPGRDPWVTSSDINPHWGYPKNAQVGDPIFNQTDAAIIIFPEGTAPAEFIVKLASEPPKANDKIGFAGFGRTSFDADGLAILKVAGYNTIDSINPNDLSLKIVTKFSTADGPKNIDLQAATMAGDSGGIVYNEKNEAIGLISNGDPETFHEATRDGVVGIKFDTMVNLFSPSIQSFMEETAGFSTRKPLITGSSSGTESPDAHRQEQNTDRGSSDRRGGAAPSGHTR